MKDERGIVIVHLKKHRAPRKTCAPRETSRKRKDKRCVWYCNKKVFVYFTVGPPKFNTPFSSISPPWRRTTKPVPKPLSPRPCESTDTLTLVKFDKFSKTTRLGRFRRPDPRRVAKTDHGYHYYHLKFYCQCHQVCYSDMSYHPSKIYTSYVGLMPQHRHWFQLRRPIH